MKGRARVQNSKKEKTFVESIYITNIIITNNQGVRGGQGDGGK